MKRFILSMAASAMLLTTQVVMYGYCRWLLYEEVIPKEFEERLKERKSVDSMNRK